MVILKVVVASWQEQNYIVNMSARGVPSYLEAKTLHTGKKY